MPPRRQPRCALPRLVWAQRRPRRPREANAACGPRAVTRVVHGPPARGRVAECGPRARSRIPCWATPEAAPMAEVALRVNQDIRRRQRTPGGGQDARRRRQRRQEEAAATTSSRRSPRSGSSRVRAARDVTGRIRETHGAGSGRRPRSRASPAFRTPRSRGRFAVCGPRVETRAARAHGDRSFYSPWRNEVGGEEARKYRVVGGLGPL